MRLWFGMAVALMFWTLAVEGQDEASLGGTAVSDVRDASLPIMTLHVELRKHDGATIETRATDDAGRFTFMNLQPGSYDLHFQAPIGGFEPGQIEIKGVELRAGERKELPAVHLTVTWTCQPPTSPSQITMLRTASAPKVTGIVDEWNGPVLSDVRVQLRSYTDLQHPVSTKTDAHGHYEFRDVPPGKYTISTQAPGLYYQGFDIYVYQGFDVLMPDFRLSRCETLDCVRPFGLCA